MRKISKSILLALFLCWLYSCQTKKEEKVEKTEDKFSNYLQHFEKVELPFTIRNYPREEEEGKNFDESLVFAYKQIPTNGDYVALITLYPVHEYMRPILTTYKPDGNIINRKELFIDSWIKEQGYMTINEDFSIYVSSDTMTMTPPKHVSPPTCFECYREGNLLPDGKIQMSDFKHRDVNCSSQ
ncbi:MAG: hypothetical protein LBN27_11315 [Prevotellaceae bacterium]|jgi:hypothetical protein|nr:hypothetical protein [Prevotellaceae bacterium]